MVLYAVTAREQPEEEVKIELEKRKGKNQKGGYWTRNSAHSLFNETSLSQAPGWPGNHLLSLIEV